MPVFIAPILVLTLVGGLSAGLIVATQRNLEIRRRRIAVCSDTAMRNGWTYQPDSPMYVGRWYGPPFNSGARGVDQIVGTWQGVPFIALSQQYTVNTGKSSYAVKYWAIVLRLRAPAPGLQLTPQTAWDSVGKFLGGQDIDVEWGAFNDRWRIKSLSDEAARAILTGAVMEYIMQIGGKMPIRIDGSDIMTWGTGDLPLAGIPWTLDYLAGLSARIPEDVFARTDLR